MSETQFKATLEMLVPLVIREITKSRQVSETEAFELLYNSFLYSELEVEATKLWHLSQLTLANLLNEELDTGVITFPEEYKAAHSLTGKEVIGLFKKYDLIDYITSCYGALHTMGGLAIVEDIDGLVEGTRRRE